MPQEFFENNEKIKTRIKKTIALNVEHNTRKFFEREIMDYKVTYEQYCKKCRQFIKNTTTCTHTTPLLLSNITMRFKRTYIKYQCRFCNEIMYKPDNKCCLASSICTFNTNYTVDMAYKNIFFIIEK